jgi:hypothetical protein
MGQDKTLEIVSRNFFWPEMEADINDYVRFGLVCEKIKGLQHAGYGLLHPLELAYALWQFISMDFIVKLLLSKEYSHIWVVVDRFCKMVYFNPIKDDTKKVPELALVFAKETKRHHSLPMDTILDCD